jgi:glycine hydroxymethyltransferase
MDSGRLTRLAQIGAELLRDEDAELHRLLDAEYQRQLHTLVLVASSSVADPSVLACGASVAINVTAEGYPGRRFHAGCRWVDAIEQLAIDRAKAVFGAQYANVQPHCASSANEIVMFGLLEPGDTILGMHLEHGGHLTHGAPVSISGRCFQAVHYGVDPHGFIDYEEVREAARRCRPRLIVCGGTAYPRAIDFQQFRSIADDVGAFLLADITHTAGLVAAGLHPNPVNQAHVTTLCTHKQVYGPRGGLILMGEDAGRRAPGGTTLSELMQRAVFPLIQGAPAPHVIAAKARALARLAMPEFRRLAHRIVANGRALAAAFMDRGYSVVSGGTDNHIVLIDLRATGLTGAIAEGALEESDIIVNRNKVPGDRRGPRVTSGIRLGTNTVSARTMEAAEMQRCAVWIDRVLSAAAPLGDTDWSIPNAVVEEVRGDIRELCSSFPIPFYPVRAALL